jgi:hypothetical protein
VRADGLHGDADLLADGLGGAALGHQVA